MSESNSIYLVDGACAGLDSLQSRLSERGYSIHLFASGQQLLEQSDLYRPACLISDVQISPMLSADLLSRLRELKSPISVIMSMDAADVTVAVTLMELGAFTLVLKPYDEMKLLENVHRAFMASERRCRQMEIEKSLSDRLSSLTVEERAVMKLILTGAPIKTVSWQLQLSERTVDRRRQSILSKMQVSSLLELARSVALIDEELA